jgi:hypothetical protein
MVIIFESLSLVLHESMVKVYKKSYQKNIKLKKGQFFMKTQESIFKF